MSEAENLYQHLFTFATPDEIAALAILYNDDFTRRALEDRDMKALTRVYQVGLTFYEDRLKDNYGVIFRNSPNKFQVIQNNKPVLTVEDDHLGSVGNAIALMLKERDGTVLPVAYTTAASSKYRPAPADVYSMVNLDALNGVSKQIAKQWPVLTKQMAKYSTLCNVPASDRTPEYEGEFVNLLCEIYTYLRSLSVDALVDFDSRTSACKSLPELFTAGMKLPDGLTVIPSAPASSDSDEEEVAEGHFTRAERKMAKMILKPLGFVKCTDKDGEYFVKSRVSLFSFVGSSFISIPALPEWGPVSRCVIPPASVSQPVVDPINETDFAASSAYPGATSLIRDYHKVDMNKFKEIRCLLVQGGISEEARDLYAGLSSVKKSALLRPIQGKVSFEEAVSRISDKLGMKADAVIAEVVAAKIVLAKSAITITCEDGVVYIDK